MSLTIEQESQKIESLEKENAAVHTESAAEVESLLSLSFSEPLPVVMQRAKDDAKNMPIEQAIKHVKVALPAEVHSLLGSETRGNSTKKAFRQEPVPAAQEHSV